MTDPAPTGTDRADAESRHRPEAADDTPWRRLDSRMIWVAAAQILLSLLPVPVLGWVGGGALGSGGLWPVAGIAAYGIVTALADAWRWTFTRYRLTDDYVERRTGLVVRSHRSVRRDRIRSVDIDARLRHRLAGLRVVNIGAGQQSSAGESAFALDAVSTTDALALRQLLQGTATADTEEAGRHADTDIDISTDTDSEPRAEAADEQVFARFRPGWVIYNVFNVWAYVMALGLLWGGYWLAAAVGIDARGFVGGLRDWDSLGLGWTIAVGVTVVSLLGVLGLGINYFFEFWNFELARVPGKDGTVLRTRQGLLRTREVDRDDNRMRGVQIAEPVLWRWLGVADTTVITTGLSIWSTQQPTAVLPRGPISVARPVAAAVLARDAGPVHTGPTDAGPIDPSPITTSLTVHPRRALRRRLWWATALTAGASALLGWLVGTGVIGASWLWTVAVLAPLALGAAFIAYRALGHAISGDYLVVRSGLVSRSTAALQRSAVSTIAVRESLLQRRLGLKTVSAMTAAGYGAYAAPDLDAKDAITFADRAAPGLLEPFLEPAPARGSTSG